MLPSRADGVEAVQIRLRDQPLTPEIVILLGPRKGARRVERHHAGVDQLQRLKLLEHTHVSVARETVDHGEVRGDADGIAHLPDLQVLVRPVLGFVDSPESGEIQALYSQENLEHTSLREQLDEFWLTRDLRIALNKEPEAQFGVDDGVAQLHGVAVLVEVVGWEE